MSQTNDSISQTDESIREFMAKDVYYLTNHIGRIIHFPGFSVVRYDGCDLRRHFTSWVVFINNEDVNDFDTLREAKQFGMEKTA